MGDFRLRILAEARNILEQEGGSHAEKESLLKLLDILTASAERILPEDHSSIENIGRQLIHHQALLAVLKQQTDELDALKKLSINLTSSLDLPDVLDAVVSEAVRLIENARGAVVFEGSQARLENGRFRLGSSVIFLNGRTDNISAPRIVATVRSPELTLSGAVPGGALRPADRPRPGDRRHPGAVRRLRGRPPARRATRRIIRCGRATCSLTRRSSIATIPKFDGFQMCRLSTRSTYLDVMEIAEHNA